MLWTVGDYSMLFADSYKAESSFSYHHIHEVREHHAYKKGGDLAAHEELDIKARMTFEDNHICIKDDAFVGMYWWKKYNDGRWRN